MAHSPLLNDHNVYILGAGFSADAGLPVIRGFLHRMRDSVDWLKAGSRTNEIDAIDRVFTFRQEAAAAAYRTVLDVENVEELFSLASAEGGETRHHDMTLAIAATLDFCRTTARGSLPLCTLSAPTKDLPDTPLARLPWKAISTAPAGRSSDYSHFQVASHDVYAAAMLGVLGEPRPDARNTFITFNYDLVLEDALRAAGASVDYGIDRKRLSADASWVHPDGVEVLKLHGSVNWAWPGGPGKKLTAFDSYADVLAIGRTPFLVPPTWRKEFSGQLVDVWERALVALTEATRVIVIGFSMPPTDHHFRYLLSAGLAKNICLRKFLFFDPYATTSVQSRALTILRPELMDRGTLEFHDMDTARLLRVKEPLAYIGRHMDSRITP